MYKALILDRDGVINADSPNYIRSLADWHPLPGSLEAIAALSRAGYPIALATNQAGIGRRLICQSDLDAIHQRLMDDVEALGGRIACIELCPHHPASQCNCRKPRPGMLHQVARNLKVALADCLFVGDSEKDHQAAQQVGCSFARITDAPGPDLRFPSLAAVAAYVLESDPQ